MEMFGQVLSTQHVKIVNIAFFFQTLPGILWDSKKIDHISTHYKTNLFLFFK